MRCSEVNMEAISPVLPSSPQFEEIVLAKDQPQYIPLPVVNIQYQSGEISAFSRYKLSEEERKIIAQTGDLWLEQMTFGSPLQPQRPMVTEPTF
jgi:hypothetical protein